MRLNVRSFIFLIFFLAIYIALNYYVSKRINGFFSRIFKDTKQYIFFIVVLLLSMSYIIYGILRSVSHLDLPWIRSIGNYWIVAFYYLVLMFFIFDMIYLLFNTFKINETGFYSYFDKIYMNGGFVLILTSIMLVYGIFNTFSFTTEYYEIKTDKDIEKITELNIAMLADIHYTSGKRDHIADAVDLINQENVDLVFLCGDIIDESTSKKDIEKLFNELKRLSTTYGTYAVVGNHETYLDYQEEFENGIRNANIKLLKDEVVFVDNNFYIAGRIDGSQYRSNNIPRMDISDLLKNIDKNRFILLLDHQPVDIENVKNESVDIQLSGHTHKGQFFPNNLITGLIYKLDYGHYEDESYNLIVTSGFGTWGPPVRLGTKGEIVFVKIDF